MEKKLQVAVQMDPPQNISIAGDSTFALMLQAQKRGYDLFYYTVDTLSLKLQPNGRKSAVVALLHHISVKDIQSEHVQILSSQYRNLEEMDVILMRQDPPFDMNYITATHILDHLQEKKTTLIVNEPRWVRECPEKILVTYFPQLMPPTLISRDYEAIKKFRDAYKDIIVKPLYGNGGLGVFRLRQGDGNLNALLELFFSISREPLMIQAFLPEISAGDKRIILIDGKPCGAINRMPSGSEHRSNMHVGGIAQHAQLTQSDKKICQIIGPFLKDHGLLFVGIDVIGAFLTEINVTSPTGLRELEKFDHNDPAQLIWESIEEKLFFLKGK